MNLLKRIEATLLDGQYGHPSGIVGLMLGEQMVRQHEPETNWTISLLDLKPGDHVLELGFGAGKAIEQVAAQTTNGHISGIDHSQTMLRSASRRNARTIKAGRVTLSRSDLATLPFSDNQFDKVFTIQTIYFWTDPQLILTEIFRVLKPGGLLIVTLSTGMVDREFAVGEQYQGLIEEQIIPGMQQLGFSQASIKEGPASRQFKTTAVIRIK